jgi:hypothetical protein
MTYGRETSNVKRETFRTKTVVGEAFLVKRISFRMADVSRFTFHEERVEGQAGCR